MFAYGAALCVADMALSPEERTYHPGVMVTVRAPKYLIGSTQLKTEVGQCPKTGLTIPLTRMMVKMT